MYKSDSILAHTRTTVANLTQRGQATLPGHLIFISVFKIFNRLAKASGFCLYFYTKRLYNHIVMPDLITIATCSLLLSGYDPRQRGGHLPFIQTKEISAFAGMTIRRVFI